MAGMQDVIVPQAEGSPEQTETRVFCLIVFPQGIEEAVIEILDATGVPGFTQSEKVTGRGSRGRHYDNPIWPGADGAIFTVTSPDQAAEASAALVELSRGLDQRSRGLYGVHVFTWPCQQVS